MEFKNFCQKANHICDKSQYKEASIWEKIKLNLHLLGCRACRKYTNRNLNLTKAFRDSDLQTLSPNEKEKLKSLLDREIKGHSQN